MQVGSIERHSDDSFEITYDITEAQVRQRFTIAHEIGHYVLGHLNEQQRCFRDLPSNFMSDAMSEKERQANAFAAELLMPEQIVKYAIEKKNVTHVVALANVFNVSQAAMSYRLKNLRITS
jgi:Zn-dependent peptidase ImmA (M78 family)